MRIYSTVAYADPSQDKDGKLDVEIRADVFAGGGTVFKAAVPCVVTPTGTTIGTPGVMGEQPPLSEDAAERIAALVFLHPFLAQRGVNIEAGKAIRDALVKAYGADPEPAPKTTRKKAPAKPKSTSTAKPKSSGEAAPKE